MCCLLYQTAAERAKKKEKIKRAQCAVWKSRARKRTAVIRASILAKHFKTLAACEKRKKAKYQRTSEKST